MSKIEEVVVKKVKELEGYVLVVGVENPKILDAIVKNKKINQSYNLKEKKKKKDSSNDGEEVTLNKLSKKIKIKANYMICDIIGINIYIWGVIRNTYKMVSDKVYFYGAIDGYEANKISKRYTRYGAKTDIKKEEDGYFITIDVSNMKVNPIKKFIYIIIDFFFNLFDAIGNGLMQ